MRGIRKLLTWLAILIVVCSVPILGIRALRPAPASTACVQLLSPTTGDVLTVDSTTGASRLDARANFPLPISNTPYRALLSPDQNLVVDAVNVGEYGPDAFRLWLGKRSTTMKRELTQQSHAHQYAWSPDSRYLAFTEMHGLGIQDMSRELVIADANANSLQRESISPALDDSSFRASRPLRWSPDGSTLAFAVYRSTIGATLLLRPATEAQSKLVSFPNAQVTHLAWSPAGETIFVVTQDAATSQATLYVLDPDGDIRNQTALSPNFFLDASTANASDLQWSPDAQYAYLLGGKFTKSQLEIFTDAGDSLLPAPLEISTLSPFETSSLWASQPHTLLYFERDLAANQQYLRSLDVATQQQSTLLTASSFALSTWPSPDAQFTVIDELRDYEHVVLHLVSRELDYRASPFGLIESRHQGVPAWSPDSQKFLFSSSTDAEFNLVWQVVASGETKRIDFPKSNDGNEKLFFSWLTNEVILIQKTMTNGSTLLLLDERSRQLLPKFSLPLNATFGYNVVWHDDRYAAISTNTTMTLYRLSDGSAVFDNLAPAAGPGAGTVTPFVEPKERALLIFRDRDSNFTRPTLSLITNSLRRIVMNADFVTLPAWSADGEAFTFAAIEKFKAGWTVKIMSRDGSLLHSFPLPAGTATTPYQQVRWTNCN